MVWDLWGYLSPIADWASLVSLLVSGLALYQIRLVRSQIVGNVRLPALISALRKNGASLAELLDDFAKANASRDILLELGRCEVNARSIQSHLARGQLRQRASGLAQMIKDYNTFGSSRTTAEDSAWKIYGELNILLEELKNETEVRKLVG